VFLGLLAGNWLGSLGSIFLADSGPVNAQALASLMWTFPLSPALLQKHEVSPPAPGMGAVIPRSMALAHSVTERTEPQLFPLLLPASPPDD
jgi:hypothetical protein